MTNKKIRIIKIILFLLLSIFLGEKKIVMAESGIFSVKPIFPENQISKQNAYYLLVKPGQKQKISFYISNLKNQDQSFRIEPGMYVNNMQGDMSLTTDKKILDKSLPVNLMSMGVKPTVISVPANKTIQVDQEYQIPNKKFKGLIYGGVRVTSGLQSSNEVKNLDKKQKNVRTFVNTYAQMDTGIIMTMDTKYPKGDLIVKNVSPVAASPSPVFNVLVQNPAGTIIDSLNVNLRIKKDGMNVKNTKFSKINLNKDFYSYTVAPYSNFNLVLDIGKERLTTGKYTLDLKAKSHGHAFNQHYKFRINESVTKKINRNNSQITPDYTWLYLIIIVAVALVLISFIVFMYLIGMKKVFKSSKTSQITTGYSITNEQNPVNEKVNKRSRYGQSNVPKRRNLQNKK